MTSVSNAREKRREKERQFELEAESPSTKPEVPPEPQVTGIASSARARRRERAREVDLREIAEDEKLDSGRVNFEDLTKQFDQKTHKQELPKRDGVRFSNDIHDSDYENLKETARLWSLSNSTVSDASPDLKRRRSDEYLTLDGAGAGKQRSSMSLLKIGSDKSFRKDNNSYVKILATLIPDEILRDINGVDPREFYAALLFADVSGFTELSEKFDKTGLGGPSRLTRILNKHIGAMIQVVLSRNGDVCKFGGDAILVFWKATSASNLKPVVFEAINSALNIQKNCQSIVDGGVEIRIKIVVTAGQVTFSVVGQRHRKYYMLIGKPVLEMSHTERLCNPGEIIVTPSAWSQVSQTSQYHFSMHSNNVHILVHDFEPSRSQKKTQNGAGNESTSIRPSLKLASNLDMESIRPFILPFVMKCVDNNEPLDYLTEMRLVTIAFLRVGAQDLGISALETVELCDIVYRNVCRLVDKAGGIVNKLTCFDKDVSILIVFGLRGFKHELASKVALKCAANCIERLKSVTQAKVSVGVTTGMVYCGVIGHLLRKEYTVMGLPVNKAARLMCAYENMVSCDRETFLRSKLRSSHFALLEQKCLKGIQHVGPVYEFNLFSKRFKVILGTNNQPLLGRSQEISEFENFISHYNNGRPTNLFLVYGNARIGKTRLITELVSVAERIYSEQNASGKHGRLNDKGKSNLDVCFIQLTEDDYKTSYSTVRLMFQPALGISESSTLEEREEKILSKLGDIKGTYFLASLNAIFNVKFGFSSNHQLLDGEEKLLAKELMRKKLHRLCFPVYSNWLIVIDDAEFIDEASWIYLKWCCMISTTPLFIMAMGRQKALSASAFDCVLSIPQKRVVLRELEKQYNTALACQILGVKAIPVELEDLLQRFKMTGNPGWLESYLMSLLQAEGLQLTYLTRHQIEEIKLVIVQEEVTTKNIGPSIGYLHATASKDLLDRTELLKTQSIDYNEILPVCILGTNFENTRNDSELTMNMMHMKTIDSLSPLEQIILKIASVLGYNFRRDALMYLISKEHWVEERHFGKAIKNLFEIRILCCDKGDFTCPSSLITNRRILLDDNFQRNVKCDCIGLVRSGALQNLPDYASCGFMRFRSPVFKDTVYKLLLDEQKKKFNYLSIEFLCNHTYRCKACHSVLFERVLGEEINGQLNLVCNKTSIHGVRSTKVKFPGAKFRSRSRSDTKLRTSLSTDVPTLNRDAGDCQCPQILCTVYSSLQEHAERAGRKDIMLEVLLEYASVNLTSHNIPLATRILEETLALVKSMREGNEHPELTTCFIFAKIYTLMGVMNLSIEKYDIALQMLDTALKYLGKKVPKSKLQLSRMASQANMKIKVVADFPECKLFVAANDKKAAYFDLLSECYDAMCAVHLHAYFQTATNRGRKHQKTRDTKSRLLAKYTSSKAMVYSLQSHRNLFRLCRSCTNILEVSYIYNDQSTRSKMEILATDILEQSANHVLELYELEAVTRLYKMIFRVRHMKAEIADALLIGLKSIRIATILRNSPLRIDLMPDLILVMIQLSRLSEAVSLLQELRFAATQYCDKAGMIWYYAKGMDFQLDTGYTIISFRECENFINEEEENFNGIRNIFATECLCTSMWLWCVRHKEWETSKRYGALMKLQGGTKNLSNPLSVLTKLKQLEGLLIMLVDRLESRSLQTSVSLDWDINRLFRELDKETKQVKAMKPRYLLIKAYHKLIRNPRANVSGMLQQALNLAYKMKDLNTVDWIIHNKLVWTNAIPGVQKTFWNDHCKFDDLIDWHEADAITEKDTLMFSLQIPRLK